jgi:hypothetical protein
MDRSGVVDYGPEGFTLSWDEQELRIQVNDYHTEVLHLSWSTVLDLARQAGVVGTGAN